MLSSSGGGAAFELISTQLISTNTASVTFTSLPTTYTHLELRYTARTTQAAANDQMKILLNSDSGSNYTERLVQGNGSTATSNGFTAQGFIWPGYAMGANATASVFALGIVSFVDYLSTAKNKTVRSISGYHTTAGAIQASQLFSSYWASTAAISSITISANGSFVSGSRFSLYGIRGS
jgi:hypothetical protein